MSGTSEVPENAGIDKSKSPKTPKSLQGRKLIQGRLPFTTVDNKSLTPRLKKNKSVDPEEEEPKTAAIKSKIEPEENHNNPLKPSAPLVDIADSTSLPDVSIIEDDKESDMNTSCNSEIASQEATPKQPGKKKTPTSRKKSTTGKEQFRKQKEEEKKRKEEEKKRKEEEKEIEKRKKEEEKKRKEEEKEAEKRKKEEEKKRKEEEKETEKKKKEEEKKRKEEEKEAEKKRKEEEKKKREEEKENEKKKKEEEEKKKKDRLSQVFTSFFTQKKTTPAKNGENQNTNNTLAFPPFQIKENMRMAPSLRTLFDDERRDILDQSLQQFLSESELYIKQLDSTKGRKCGPTWPINKEDNENEIEVIDEDDASLNNKDDIIMSAEPSVGSALRRMKAKMFKFHENRRPAYWGTWSKTSHAVGPRRPYGKEPMFDYEVDSDDEWEEEVEPGESLTDSEGEGEEKEPADDYEVDNEFLVPHGYLSDEEGEKEEDEQPLSPSAAKAMLKIKGEQFERELKEKTCHIKPSLIGCCWSGAEEQEPQLYKVLQRYSAVICTVSPICLNSNELVCDNTESTTPMVDGSRSEKSVKKAGISEADVPSLIKILHGAYCSKFSIVKEFQAHLERNRAQDSPINQGPSKGQIVAKIHEIASWMKCTEAGAMNGRTCWLVHNESLQRYNLGDLSAINSWEFSTDKKKRGRKMDESKGMVGDDATPPSKTARISLIKKFIQTIPPPDNSAVPTAVVSNSLPNSVTSPVNNSPPSLHPVAPLISPQSIVPGSTPKAKKRIALISLSSSVSKKPRKESIASPLTNYLKKMGAKESPSTNQLENETSEKIAEKEHDCFTID